MLPQNMPHDRTNDLRIVLRKTLVVVGLTQIAVTAIVNLTLIVLVISSLALIVLGLIIHSAATVAIGTILNLTLLFMFRWHSRIGLRLVLTTLGIVIDVVFRLLILAYIVSAIALLIGGLWISQFNLTVVGFVLSIPIILYLHSESPSYSPRGWILPPEEHLLTNRLRSQNELQSDGQKLWRE